MQILDAGCGEGKNAVYLAGFSAFVRAIDVSPLAIRNAKMAWGNPPNVTWEIADIRTTVLPRGAYDVIVAYGLLHCLPSVDDVHLTAQRLQEATAPGGYNVICAFNNRTQDLRDAHPNLRPTLLTHDDYRLLYSPWAELAVSDSDLHESHPDRSVPHVHSLTRLLARKPA
jgi:2-polyprenyl-3-methyl-5-hydroxy-6-metoxy-1,4-benzoquinol methylase